MKSEIIITIPAYTKEPNKNGVIFSEKAIKKAIKNLEKIPLIDRTCANFADGIDNYIVSNISAIGIIEKAKFKKRQDVIKFQGKLINVETSYVKEPDTENIIFTGVSLVPCNEKGE